MATGASSDLLPVRKDTKRRLSRLKGDRSYDALLRVLLDLVPEDAILREMRGVPPTAEPRARPPEKQLLIARLAQQRWKDQLETGRLVERGPRLFTWKQAPEVPREVTFATLPRRGLSP